MATCSSSVVKKKKLVEVEVEEKIYTLTLSQAELKTLKIVLSSVGGSTQNTARKYVNSIFNNIEGGIRSFSKCFEDSCNTLYLTEYSLEEVES